MTSEINEDRIYGESSQTHSLPFNNNDIVLNCLAPTCSGFSTKVTSNETIASVKACDEIISAAHGGDELPTNQTNNKLKIFSTVQNENTKVCQTNVCGHKGTMSDKYPSRWASKMVEHSESGEKELSTFKNHGNACTENVSSIGCDFECNTESKTKFSKTNMRCDQEESAVSPSCDGGSISCNTSLYPVGKERERLGKEAIETLASELNKAATTIQDFAQNECDEQMLKELNDEQLFKLLEEAYHSKKLDEKNKSSIFKIGNFRRCARVN